MPIRSNMSGKDSQNSSVSVNQATGGIVKTVILPYD